MIDMEIVAFSRGRWNAGATSPRFRGRGFQQNQMGQQMRGRGGGPQFFRGGNRAGAPRFPNSGNFDPNWNGPPMYGNSHMGFGNQQGDQQNAPFHQVCYTCIAVLWILLFVREKIGHCDIYKRNN